MALKIILKHPNRSTFSSKNKNAFFFSQIIKNRTKNAPKSYRKPLLGVTAHLCREPKKYKRFFVKYNYECHSSSKIDRTCKYSLNGSLTLAMLVPYRLLLYCPASINLWF